MNQRYVLRALRSSDRPETNLKQKTRQHIYALYVIKYAMIQQQSDNETMTKKRYKEENELLLYPQIFTIISQFGLRPAAVEIIHGCVYHYKYFELLNSNQCKRWLERGDVQRPRMHHEETSRRPSSVSNISELSDISSLRHLNIYPSYNRPAKFTLPVF